MRIHVLEDYQELSHKAASFVASQIILRPHSVLGLATGSTPRGLYSHLIQMEDLDFGKVQTFNLDEYLGLEPDHPHSYHYYMQEHLFRHINISPAGIHIPPGQPDDLEQACREYDRAITAAGGIDLQILGIGHNGHIGFNEPASRLKTATHVVDLSPSTIEANSRFFSSPEEVPRRAISMGLGSIMRARKILLLASGGDKAEIVARTVGGEITTRVPASLLQLHPEVIIMVDKEAGSQLPLAQDGSE